MEKFPCINCLTLPICKSTVKKFSDYDRSYSVIYLGRKCKLIKDLIESYTKILNHGIITYGSHRQKSVSRKDIEETRASFRELANYLHGEYKE